MQTRADITWIRPLSLRLRAAGATVMIPESGKQKVPDGVVMMNGAKQTVGDIIVEAIAAYDFGSGEPYHAKGAGERVPGDTGAANACTSPV